MGKVEFRLMNGYAPERKRNSTPSVNGQPSANGVRQFAQLAILFVLLGPFFSCGLKPNSRSANFFPTSDEVHGWTKSGETRTFPASRLWEYIDGDADKYIHAGVLKTLTADYRYDQKIDAVADVFVMSGAAGAADVFNAQSAVGSQPIQIGDEARLYRGTLTFRKGRYLVRLVAYEDAPQAPEALIALGRSIASRLE
jgi:Family of unknown function (DUF6599)